ncbi:hypothetical protein CPJCM30710_09810 [Clostridium polyendosporum]|uniref:Radical SAM core domain-containing protein n=1 Tax=Clostridium polyendosporum TaxID=69208 RepID=A0A919RZE8_9CLOT|nr:radical SAM protein [Clostridium polyendosporum]GIM28315.1 hypothetical protein CPJCM30710_09810 [Clostridium polyendosporum]
MVEKQTVWVRNPEYTLHYWDKETYLGLIRNKNSGETMILSPLSLIIYTFSDGKFTIDDAYALIESYKSSNPIINSMDTDIKWSFKNLIEKGAILPSDEEGNRVSDRVVGSRKKVPELSSIYLYVTQACNLRCAHCYQRTDFTNKGRSHDFNQDVSMDDIFSVIDEAIPLGLSIVKITGGEPLLRPNIKELITGLVARNVEVAIETNGTMIDSKMAAFLAKNMVNISISLDGSTAERHDKIRRVKGAYDLAIQAIKHLAPITSTLKVITAVSKDNIDDIENISRLIAGMGVKEHKINPVNELGITGEREIRKIMLNPIEVHELFKNLQKKDFEKKYGLHLFMEGPPSFFKLKEIALGQCGSCPFLNILGVLSNGELSFCGIGYTEGELKFGSAGMSSVKNIWENNEILKEARECMPNGITGVCNKCVLLDRCHGSCRALAYQGKRVFSEPHPWCQYLYERGVFPAEYLVQ